MDFRPGNLLGEDLSGLFRSLTLAISNCHQIYHPLTR
jgi:hypothetical protein